MKNLLLKSICFLLIVFASYNFKAQNFQGKAVYVSKSTMDLGSWGSRLSEGQKKQVMQRLKNRLEKTYTLTFNSEVSIFKEDDKIDAISGATDSWGGYFSRGDQYKNVKKNSLYQSQEFYGKRFLIKDKLYKIDWTLGTETKKIGSYTCYKAKAFVPYKELNWYSFSWGDLRKKEEKKDENGKVIENLIVVEAWYAPQIPVSQGPGEYWGLPGLILEVSTGKTTLLCTEISISTKEKVTIVAPSKGKEITKVDYNKTVKEKMVSMRNNRMRRRSR